MKLHSAISSRKVIMAIIRVYGFIILGCLMLPSYTQELFNTLCEPSLCLFLYDAGYTYKTWRQSYEACTGMDQDMLRIESDQTQTAVNSLLLSLPSRTLRQVWIAEPQMSNYSNWYHNEKNQTSDNDCIYIDVDRHNKWFLQGCFSYLKYYLCMTENPVTTSDMDTDITPVDAGMKTVGTETAVTSSAAALTENTAVVATTTDSLPEASAVSSTTWNTASTASSTDSTPEPESSTVTTNTDHDLTTTEQPEINKCQEPANDNSPRTRKLNIIYIAVALAGVLILSLTIWISVCCVRKKKRRKASGPQSSAQSAKEDEPVYIDFSPVEEDGDSILNQYEEIPFDAEPNNEVARQLATSVEVFPVPDKFRKERKKKTDKHVRSPEGLYAAPNKKRNRKKKQLDDIVKEGLASEVNKCTGFEKPVHYQVSSEDIYSSTNKVFNIKQPFPSKIATDKKVTSCLANICEKYQNEYEAPSVELSTLSNKQGHYVESKCLKKSPES